MVLELALALVLAPMLALKLVLPSLPLVPVGYEQAQSQSQLLVRYREDAYSPPLRHLQQPYRQQDEPLRQSHCATSASELL
jgi:hypothetical protein